jgi:hypothetical protein
MGARAAGVVIAACAALAGSVQAAPPAVWWLPGAWGASPGEPPAGPRFAHPPRTFHEPQFASERSRGYDVRRLRWQGWGTPRAVAHGQARTCADDGFCSPWAPVRIELRGLRTGTCARAYLRYRASGALTGGGRARAVAC